MTSTTATRTDALAELEALERVWQKAVDEASALDRKHFDAKKRLFEHLDERGLLAERQRLMDREPDQYHPDGSPRRKDSKAGLLQAEIDTTPDPAGLALEVEHARRIERRAKQDVDAVIAENFPALVEARRPSAEAAAADVKAKAQELAEALGV